MLTTFLFCMAFWERIFFHLQAQGLEILQGIRCLAKVGRKCWEGGEQNWLYIGKETRKRHAQGKNEFGSSPADAIYRGTGRFHIDESFAPGSGTHDKVRGHGAMKYRSACLLRRSS